MQMIPSPLSMRTSTTSRQRGVSLIVVLLILVVVTVLGLGAAQMAMLGERATRVDRDHQIAWEAAQAALVDAQFDINGNGPVVTSARAKLFAPGSLVGFASNCANTSSPYQGLCLPNTSGKELPYSVDIGTVGTPLGTYTGRTFQAGSTGLSPAQPPRYVIEAMRDLHTQSSLKDDAPQPLIYRVTAIGYGPTTTTQVVLQMVYRKST